MYIDDILVTGSTDEQHLHRLGEVFKCIKDAGLKLKHEKCAFSRSLLSIWET